MILKPEKFIKRPGGHSRKKKELGANPKLVCPFCKKAHIRFIPYICHAEVGKYGNEELKTAFHKYTVEFKMRHDPKKLETQKRRYANRIRNNKIKLAKLKGEI